MKGHLVQQAIRGFSKTRSIFKNVPKYDDADLMAGRLNHDIYTAKRLKTDFQWSEQSSAQKEKEHQERIEKVLRLTAVLQGALFLAGIGAAGTLYLKWPQVKAWWVKGDSKLDDTIIEKLKSQRQKKAATEIPFIPADQQPSSVPGVYYWGRDESGKPQKFPLRVTQFDGQYVRDVALTDLKKNLAIDNKGDLLQWGDNGCEPLLCDQDLIKVKISNYVAYCLNRRGEILIVPLEEEILRRHHSDFKRSLLTPWKKACRYNWKLPTDELFNKGEKIVDFDVGKEHLVCSTNWKKAYSCATGLQPLENSKSKGQFGVPELSQFDPYPECHELHDIELLNYSVVGDKVIKRNITKIACGDYHTLAIDDAGDLYSFGLNTYGQLGQPISYDTECVPFPKRVTSGNAHFPRDSLVRYFDIHCSGNASYAGVKPHRVKHVVNNKFVDLSSEKTDVVYFSFGNGLNGELGNGHYKHSQNEPTKIKFEMQASNPLVKEWSCGSNHNMCKLENDEVVTWGLNDFGQLGNGKKIKSCKPMSIPKILEPGSTYEENVAILSSPKKRLLLGPNQHIKAGNNSSCIFWSKN
ncbi:LAMI_0G17502g1_1 [Lachancea mirantina]|uniref:LAMI_0G17502g1_1 n=1 Tax=Lachancea mirantina TaxID=1230905 RepID=A0A1G4KD78_9SACH|nr:LAMI_0G17502g1_1 [Lachancea mirantina]